MAAKVPSFPQLRTQRGLNYLHMISTYLGYPVKKIIFKMFDIQSHIQNWLLEFSFWGVMINKSPSPNR